MRNTPRWTGIAPPAYTVCLINMSLYLYSQRPDDFQHAGGQLPSNLLDLNRQRTMAGLKAAPARRRKAAARAMLADPTILLSKAGGAPRDWGGSLYRYFPAAAPMEKPRADAHPSANTAGSTGVVPPSQRWQKTTGATQDPRTGATNSANSCTMTCRSQLSRHDETHRQILLGRSRDPVRGGSRGGSPRWGE